jgi:hypothetical protein
MFSFKVALTQAEMNVISPPPPAAPVAPVAPQITVINGVSPTTVNPTVSITFTQSPADATITKYAYSIDGSSYTDLIQTSSPLTVPITGLTSGTSHTFRIKASNSASSYSAESTGVSSIVVYIPPTTPIITSVTSSSQSVKIYFTQTPTDSSITNYAYSYSKNSGTFTNFVDFSPAQTTSFLTLSGLINGHSYTFKLKAKNGPASYSAVSNVSSSVLIRPLLTEMITTSATITDMLNSGYTLQEMKDAGVKGDHPQNLSNLLYALSDFYPPHIKLSGDITSESAFSLRTTSNNPIQLIASGSDPVHLFVRS